MKITNVVMGDVHTWDAPDFCDAYIESADIDGRPATEAELDALNADGSLVNEFAHESLR